MKTVIITVSESSVTNNLLRGAFFTLLKHNQDLRIVLVVPEAKQESYRNEFGADQVLIEPFSYPNRSFRERINFFLSRNALKTDMVQFVQMRQFYDDKKYFLLLAKRILSFIFGRSMIFQSLVRSLELRVPTPHNIRTLFDRYKPDLVFATVANYTEMDVPVLREAKKRRIRTIGMMRGWDAFVAHGFLRVIPDQLLLPNEYMRESGHEFQFLHDSVMAVVGSPAFDWHFRKDLIKTREEFCRDVGIDPRKRIILFGAMEYYWYPRDADIAEVFDDFIKKKELPDDVVLLFRPYPGQEGPVERVKKLTYVIPDLKSFTLLHGDDIEMREKQVSHFLSSIVHSEIMISVASTIGIDGVALGKPAISALFEKEEMPYWFSIKRFFTHTTHFMEVFNTGGIRTAKSRKEFVGAIRTYLDNPSIDSEGRKRLKEKFIEPYDGKAGELVARIVTNELANATRI